jgi:TPR repeat protein
MGNLIEYRRAIEKEALKGSLRAALALAKLYEDGLAVEKNVVTAYAWLLIGKQFGSRDDDEVARNELYEHTLTVYSELSRDEQAEAYRLVEVMCGPSTRSDTKRTGS